MPACPAEHPDDRQADSAQPARGERVQKVLAAAGFGSRRQCEELILAGRVEVDRRTVEALGARVDLASQELRVDGQAVRRGRPVYYLVNKPTGVVSTNRDPAGRTRVIDLVPDKGGHLFAVGRLDMSSEGLILVTNDGELTNRLTHPRYGIRKTYQVEVAGQIGPRELERFRRGIHLAEGLAHAEAARVKKQFARSTLLEIVLAEGKNRELRRMLARSGHKVLRLKRIAIGPLRMADMPPGSYRRLERAEVRALEAAVAAQEKRAAAKPLGPRRPAGKPLAQRGKSAAPSAGRTVIGGGRDG